MRKIGLLLTALLVLFMVSGISGCKTDSGEIYGVTWRLHSYELNETQHEAVPQAMTTAIFNSDQMNVSGSGGVNSYSATLKINGSIITITDLISTKMAGQPPMSTQEMNFFNLIQHSQSFKIQDHVLTITCSDGELVFDKIMPVDLD